MFTHGFFSFMVSFILGLVALAVFGVIIMSIAINPKILITISIFLGAVVELFKKW